MARLWYFGPWEPGAYLENPPLSTKKPSVVYQNPSRQTPKKLPKSTTKLLKCTKKTPCLFQKKPIDIAGVDPHKSNMHQQKHPFYQKKQLSFPCMLYLWTIVYQQTNLVAPFHTKRPQDGLRRGFHLSTTFYNTHTPRAPKQNTERTLTFTSMTFHLLSYLHA